MSTQMMSPIESHGFLIEEMQNFGGNLSDIDDSIFMVACSSDVIHDDI